jgi:hypothetical protein
MAAMGNAAGQTPATARAAMGRGGSETAATGKAMGKTVRKAGSERAAVRKPMGKAVGKAGKAVGKAATGKAMGEATGKAVRKAATGRARGTRERECGGRKHGAADGSGGRQNEDGFSQHDKLLCRYSPNFVNRAPLASCMEAHGR